MQYPPLFDNFVLKGRSHLRQVKYFLFLGFEGGGGDVGRFDSISIFIMKKRAVIKKGVGPSKTVKNIFGHTIKTVSNCYKIIT